MVLYALNLKTSLSNAKDFVHKKSSTSRLRPKQTNGSIGNNQDNPFFQALLPRFGHSLHTTNRPCRLVDCNITFHYACHFSGKSHFTNISASLNFLRWFYCHSHLIISSCSTQPRIRSKHLRKSKERKLNQ